MLLKAAPKEIDIWIVIAARGVHNKIRWALWLQSETQNATVILGSCVWNWSYSNMLQANGDGMRLRKGSHAFTYVSCMCDWLSLNCEAGRGFSLPCGTPSFIRMNWVNMLRQEAQLSQTEETYMKIFSFFSTRRTLMAARRSAHARPGPASDPEAPRSRSSPTSATTGCSKPSGRATLPRSSWLGTSWQAERWAVHADVRWCLASKAA